MPTDPNIDISRRYPDFKPQFTNKEVINKITGTVGNLSSYLLPKVMSRPDVLLGVAVVKKNFIQGKVEEFTKIQDLYNLSSILPFYEFDPAESN